MKYQLGARCREGLWMVISWGCTFAGGVVDFAKLRIWAYMDIGRGVVANAGIAVMKSLLS
jgi:hypothetical protein